MKYRVFHAERFQFPPPRWPDGYRLVAEVDAADPQAAFARTNSHDRHWSLQPGVTCIDPEARSTSIGDVVVSPAGEAFRCEPVGWKRL
jgi:hypothetical protein